MMCSIVWILRSIAQCVNDVVTVTTFYLDVMFAGIVGGDEAWAIRVSRASLSSLRHLEAFMKLVKLEDRILRGVCL